MVDKKTVVVADPGGYIYAGGFGRIRNGDYTQSDTEERLYKKLQSLAADPSMSHVNFEGTDGVKEADDRLKEVRKAEKKAKSDAKKSSESDTASKAKSDATKKTEPDATKQPDSDTDESKQVT